ncbi:hypothetical protein [Photorhabdus asymbiotica]|uniref:Uncharacterized protein n=1 Tax=Photorhabdus asymbiotica TaxID=291112 RepID=A0ABX9SL51_9GAMM|nr:hypothetical protein [Photorhabdus asymbiotica]RKS57775.1 hypothetical protein BDD30_2588 [Photorhabdus asymbiotica]
MGWQLFLLLVSQWSEDKRIGCLYTLYNLTVYIPFIFQVAAFTHPSHIAIYNPGDAFTCRHAATRNLLGILGESIN